MSCNLKLCVSCSFRDCANCSIFLSEASEDELVQAVMKVNKNFDAIEKKYHGEKLNKN